MRSFRKALALFRVHRELELLYWETDKGGDCESSDQNYQKERGVMNAYLAKVIEDVKNRHAGEPEFVQTVEVGS